MDVAALFASAKAGMDVNALMANTNAQCATTCQPSSVCSKADVSAKLVKAAKDGDHTGLLRIIEQSGGSADLDHAPGFDGNAPLHWAVEKGHMECVRVLCEHGANVDVRERWQGWTPLMIAASKGKMREAALLLKHRATVSTGAKGKTALSVAAGPLMVSLLQAGSSSRDTGGGSGGDSGGIGNASAAAAATGSASSNSGTVGAPGGNGAEHFCCSTLDAPVVFGMRGKHWCAATLRDGLDLRCSSCEEPASREWRATNAARVKAWRECPHVWRSLPVDFLQVPTDACTCT